ncbi:L-2-hydroxyglutarate dehydrogenase, mitochondrial [Frankliniella occidentalis]|uniref:L-2-hydroxyglutarate dehydrogenase, mitochondrial n=1 Tax=Frankliniella occidentalis TaxID=133901 RepID=A0A6J1TCF2_FRAOC|nr:L-2-hydroxyglutarate dehydrogenase, mitochondrial [Frankliniella occidentalis]
MMLAFKKLSWFAGTPSRLCFITEHNRLGKLKHSFRTLTTDSSNNCFDVVVVGGGIVGVASARELMCRYPNLKVAIVEKENQLAAHQTGHNSGVIHAGIYYKPGTLKAKLCVEGLHLTYDFCDKHNVPYKKVGKLIVARDRSEEARLLDLYDRGQQNNVPELRLIDSKEIREYEPFCQGWKALHSPHTGIVDWGLVTEYYGKDFKKRGGEIFLNFHVTDFNEAVDTHGGLYPIRVSDNSKSINARYVLTCGGLHSDRLAKLSGCNPVPQIVPFRGEYLLLSKEKQHMVKGNIYPVPDPRFPFLGVHFTPRMDGSIWLGPNAVLAFQREGYRWSDINMKELIETLKFPGFRNAAAKHITFGCSEMLRSVFIQLQLKELRRFIPNIEASDISRGPSGVRAQAMDLRGELVDDFVFDSAPASAKSQLGPRILHCRNAPSPGATSSLAIAKMIVDKLKKEFNL